jgi:predicted RNA binding protein YcfA (HicA-like mRNA interferase family)
MTTLRAPINMRSDPEFIPVNEGLRRLQDAGYEQVRTNGSRLFYRKGTGFLGSLLISKDRLVDGKHVKRLERRAAK